MEGEFVEMGKLIGAGLACTGMGGAAIGVGHVVGNYLSGALRNPNAAAGQTATMFIGIAFAEALGIFSFLVALLLMYAMWNYYFIWLQLLCKVKILFNKGKIWQIVRKKVL